MPSSKLSQQYRNLSLIINIQSGLVRSALISSEQDGSITLGTVSHSYTAKAHVSGAVLTSTMLAHIEENVREIVKQAGIAENSIASVHYIFSSPWIVSQSKTVKIKYENDTEITEVMVQNILHEERVILQSAFKKENSSEEHRLDLALIEQKIFNVRLNGYSVESYNGKKARTLEISFAVTWSSQKIQKKIHDAVSRVIHIPREFYHSGLLLHYVALRSLVEKDEYIFVHVHGELTDIVVIKRELSSSIASFPFGTGTLMRKLSHALKASAETTDSTLSLYEDGKLNEAEKARIDKIILPLLANWQEQLMHSLSAIPHSVYLSVCSSSCKHFGLFKKTLEGHHFDVTAFDKPLMEIYTTALRDML